MPLETALTENRDAVEDLKSSALAAANNWTTPRSSGKWSPSQVVEHVAMSYEEGANVLAGRQNAFPTLPAFLRPIVRSLLFNRTLKKGTFPKARTTAALDPSAGPASPDEAQSRLDDALAKFESECRSVAEPTIVSSAFGEIAVEDYARFMAIHTRHHRLQISTT